MNKYTITYIGTPENIPITQEDLLSKFNCHLKKFEYIEDKLQSLLESIIKINPQIIMIEVNNLNNDFLNLLLLLKSHSKLKRSLIVALFPDKNGSDKYEDIYSFGIDYGFIISEEKERMLNDLEFLLNPSGSSPAQYAQVKNLKIPAEVTFLSKISHITEENLFIETSLPLSINQEIKAKLKLDSETCLRKFKVTKLNNFLARSCFTLTAQIKALPQEEVTSTHNSNNKSFKSLYQKLECIFFKRNDPALIIDHLLYTFARLVGEMNVNNQFIKISNNYLNIENQFAIFKPQIICFQMQQEADDMAEDERLRLNGVTTFTKMLNLIKSIANYNPFILIFNQNSRSQAYRKAYDYNNIIVNKNQFELYTLTMLMEEFQNHRNESQKIKYLKPPEESTKVEIINDIIITSLSENIITFHIRETLPSYSTFKISDPLNIYVTVVPDESQREVMPNMSHHFGFISNTNEEDKMRLRKLVNLLIRAELEDSEIFTLKSITELQEDIIKEKIKVLKKTREEQRRAYLIKKTKGDSDQD